MYGIDLKNLRKNYKNMLKILTLMSNPDHNKYLIDYEGQLSHGIPGVTH